MDFATSSKIVVTCHRGLSPALASELQSLGFTISNTLATGVETTGSLNDCVRLNLSLRCASQVLYSLNRFRCQSPEQLYRQVRGEAWEQILAPTGYFTIHNYVSHSSIKSSMFANVKVKDAIVDRMREKTGRRPDSGSEMLGAVVYLFWRDSFAELFLDTSGETIAKHGYRQRPGLAPLAESLAAGLLLSSHWDTNIPLVNPMCGSGTLAIEAAMMMTNRRPGLLRSNYAFQHILGYQPERFQHEQRLLHQQIDSNHPQRIFASDICAQAVETARINATSAGVQRYIQFDQCDFQSTPLPTDRPMVVMLNPEYGTRMGNEQELLATYARIGDFFKQRCSDSWGYVFTGNMLLGKHVGLKSRRRMEFHTAQLECRLLEYELYSGSRNGSPPTETPP